VICFCRHHQLHIASILLDEGRLLETILKAERDRGVLRPRLVTAAPEGSETARRALRPVPQGACCTCSAGNGGAGNADPRPKIATVWSAERRGVPIARDAGAPRKRPGLPRKQATGASQAPGACRRSPTPHGVDKVQTPGAIAPRERVVLRVGLFDIVKKDCGHAQGTKMFPRARSPAPTADRMGGAMSISACPRSTTSTFTRVFDALWRYHHLARDKLVDDGYRVSQKIVRGGCKLAKQTQRRKIQQLQ